MTSSDFQFARNAAQHRFELRQGETLAGIAEYREEGDRVVFTHTKVEPAFEGKGVGSRLARAALDDVRAQGRKVEARCEFIAGWIAKHPDYADLLAS